MYTKQACKASCCICTDTMPLGEDLDIFNIFYIHSESGRTHAHTKSRMVCLKYKSSVTYLTVPRMIVHMLSNVSN